MKVIEEKLKHCNKCEMQTTHQRNNTKTGFIMFLVHIVLILCTAGLWLILLIFHSLLTAKVGGWKCSKCVNVSLLHKKIF